LGYAGILEQGLSWGIYGGLYLVIALILTLGSRVIPFFIERGISYPVKLYNPKWIILSSLLIFLVFAISALFLHDKNIIGITSVALFIIYSIRLVGWHIPGIWKKPLLWSLYSAMLFINIIFFPLFLSEYSLQWIICSQVLWLVAFLLFVISYAPILIKAE
jgi:uncharacterized protein involved in response to NO